MKNIISTIMLSLTATMGFAESSIDNSTITLYRTALPSWAVAPSAVSIIPASDDNSFGTVKNVYNEFANTGAMKYDLGNLMPFIGHSYDFVDFTPFIDAPLPDGAFSRSKGVAISGLSTVAANHNLPDGFDTLGPRDLPYFKITAEAQISETGGHVLKLAEGEFVDVYFVMNILHKSPYGTGCGILGNIGDLTVQGSGSVPKVQYKKKLRLENNKTHQIDFDLICTDANGALADVTELTHTNGYLFSNVRVAGGVPNGKSMFDARTLPYAFPKFRYGLVVEGTKTMVPFSPVEDVNKSRVGTPKHEDPELDVFWSKGGYQYAGWKKEPFHTSKIDMVTPEKQDVDLNHYRNSKSFIAKGLFYPKEQGIYEMIMVTESNLCARFSHTKEVMSWSWFEVESEQVQDSTTDGGSHLTQRLGDPLYKSSILSPPTDVKVFNDTLEDSLRESLPCIAYVHPASMLSFRDGDAPLRLPYNYDGMPTRALHTTIVFDKMDVEYGTELLFAGKSILFDNNQAGTPIFEAYAADLDEKIYPAVSISDWTDREQDASGYSVNSDYNEIDYVYTFPATTRVSDRFNPDTLIEQKISLYIKPPNELHFRPLNKLDFQYDEW